MIDMTDEEYGRLTVRAYHHGTKRDGAFWSCDCACGTTNFIVSRKRLKTKNTKSCGCLAIEKKVCKKRHGASRTPEYFVWIQLKDRCCNQNNKRYKNYGGRGITVCERWLHSFENFIADVGLRPSPKHTIERRENDKPYSPDNCRWATNQEQQQNKSNNHLLTYNNETLTITEWGRQTGFDRRTIAARLRRGMSVEQAFTAKLWYDRNRN